MNEFNTIIILKNDSTANWLTNAAHVLRRGEVGIEFLDDGNVKMKVGDGEKTWAELSYFGGEESHVFEATPNANETHENAIARVVGDVTPVKGDVAVIKEPISDDKDSYTAYVYNGSKWAAMDGNYNASNVYFDEDLTYTANIGALSLGSDNSKVLAAKGKSLESVLKAILAQTKDPTIDQPSFSLSASYVTDTGTVEIGSKITKLTWNGTYSKGSYEFGSKDADGNVTTDTTPGITPSFAVSANVDESLSGSTEDGSFTLAESITIDSDSSKTYATVKSVASWGNDTVTPVNNIGEEVEGAIEEGSIEKTANVTIDGYRNGCFYGTVSNAEITPETITSAVIRGLSSTKKDYASGSVTISVPAGATSVIIACPVGKTGPSYVLNTTVNAPMSELYGADQVKTVVSVGGGDASDSNLGDYAADYNVWMFTPANPYGSTASLTVTLAK